MMDGAESPDKGDAMTQMRSSGGVLHRSDQWCETFGCTPFSPINPEEWDPRSSVFAAHVAADKVFAAEHGCTVWAILEALRGGWLSVLPPSKPEAVMVELPRAQAEWLVGEQPWNAEHWIAIRHSVVAALKGTTYVR